MQGVIAFFVGLALAAWGGSDTWLLGLFAGGGVLAWCAWRSIAWPDQWSHYLSFGSILLLACMVNRLLYIADIAWTPQYHLQWPFYATHPLAATIKAEVATVGGTLLACVAWLAAGGMRYSPALALREDPGRLRAILGVAYTGSLAALAISIAWPTAAAVAGQLLPTMLGMGATTAFILPLLLARGRTLRLALVTLMILPFLYTALGTGMKENIILAMAPSAYLAWTYSRRVFVRVSILLVAALLVALLTSYISYFRNEVWYADRAIAQQEVLSEYVDSIQTQGTFATVGEGMRSFLVRSNAGSYRGWAVSLADDDGFEPKLAFAPLTYALVPRILWPGKPEIRQGFEFSRLVFGDAYVASTDSSLSAGLFSALYLGGGWLAVLLGATGIGLMMAGLSWLAHRLGGPVLAGLFSLSLLPYALRLDENWIVGAFTAPVITFAYVALIFVAARGVAGLLPDGR